MTGWCWWVSRGTSAATTRFWNNCCSTTGASTGNQSYLSYCTVSSAATTVCATMLAHHFVHQEQEFRGPEAWFHTAGVPMLLRWLLSLASCLGSEQLFKWYLDLFETVWIAALPLWSGSILPWGLWAPAKFCSSQKYFLQWEQSSRFLSCVPVAQWFGLCSHVVLTDWTFLSLHQHNVLQKSRYDVAENCASRGHACLAQRLRCWSTSVENSDS